MRHPTSTAIALLALALPVLVQAQSAPDPHPLAVPSLALVTAYADGRVGQQLVSEKPTFGWTPYFPRTEGVAASSDRRALKVARVRVGNDVRVTVSMLSGPGLRDEELVTTVTVSMGRTVTVDRLRDFGVEPIVLSLIDAVPMNRFVPSVISVSPEIDISRIEVLTTPLPGYRVTLRNLGSQAVALFGVQSYRGTERAVSGVMRGNRGQPVMAPGATHTFDLPAGEVPADTGAAVMVPQPVDVIEIDSVLWEDGRVIGHHSVPLTFVTATDGGRRLQFERALNVLRAAQRERGRSATDLLSQVRQGFGAIPDTDDTRLEPARQMMRATRAMVLGDLEAFEAQPVRNIAAVRRWVERTIAEYEGWLKRLAAETAGP
jgi:hypothetical protein